jgi:hypothetical protein
MRRITMLALAAVLALTGAACGDDDDSSDEAETTDDGGSTDDGSTTDDGGDDGATDSSAFLDEDCQFLLAGLNPLAGLSPGSDTDIQDLSDQMQAAAEEAPDEIQDAMATIADGYAEMAEALDGVDLSDPQALADPEVSQKLAELESTFDDDFQAASETVSEYMTENCSG